MNISPKQFVIALVCIIIVLILLWYVYQKKDTPQHSKGEVNYDTWFFLIEDINGQKSIIHDSGIKELVTSPGLQKLCFLKKEINNGRVITLDRPQKIFLGRDHARLDTNITDFDLSETDDGLQYCVTFSL